MTNEQNLQNLQTAMKTLSSFLDSCTPFSQLEDKIENYINTTDTLNQKANSLIAAGLHYSKQDHQNCLSIYHDVRDIWEKMIVIFNARDLVVQRKKSTTPIPFDTILQLSQLDSSFEKFCPIVGDKFIKLYHDTEDLLDKYNGIQYYNENIKQCKKKKDALDKEKSFDTLNRSLKTYQTLSSLVLSNRTDTMFIKNEIVLLTCASDFANYVLKTIEQKGTADISYTDLIDNYFFAMGASSKVYNLTQKLLKDHDPNSEFNCAYLYKNNALGYKFIRELNICANSIIFSPTTTAQEKIDAYILLCGCIKNYNKCIKGLLGKCTYEDYKLSETQKTIVKKYISTNDSFSFKDLISLLKQKYHEESGYYNILDFVKYKRDCYLVKNVNAQVEDELNIN